MTGEITLRGRVLPIGGLREKMLAAVRAGITTIIVPAANEPDLSEIPADLRAKIEVHLVSELEEVLRIALREFSPKPRPRPSTVPEAPDTPAVGLA